MDLPVYDMPVYEPALYGDVVHPIESGGNCGYIAIQMGLIAVGEHDQIVPAGPFRQRIYDYAAENEHSFTHDVVARRRNGGSVYPLDNIRPNKNKNEVKRRFWTREVLNKIWMENVDFDRPVSHAHWMDGMFVLPIIVHMYRLTGLIVYQKVSVGRYVTLIYRYQNGLVLFEEVDGVVPPRTYPPIYDAHLVFADNRFSFLRVA